jgi:hypothetical protein
MGEFREYIQTSFFRVYHTHVRLELVGHGTGDKRRFVS